MYEGLVALLRKKYDKAPMVMEAAGAIEELSRLAEVNAKRAMKWAADAEKAEKAQRWVSVTERLPDEKHAEDVLCWITDGDPKAEGYCVSGCYNTLTKSWCLDADWVASWKITHWMPAPQGPKPPKEEE